MDTNFFFSRDSEAALGSQSGTMGGLFWSRIRLGKAVAGPGVRGQDDRDKWIPTNGGKAGPENRGRRQGRQPLNYRAGGGGPVRVRVRIDTQLSSRGGWTGSSSSSSSDRHTIIEPGGVDRFEFEFEFRPTHNYRAGGGWTGSSSSSDRHTIIEPGGVDRFEFEFEFGSTAQLSSRGGWTGSSSSSSSDRRLRDL